MDARSDCTNPNDYESAYPCINRCINIHELLMVLVLLFASANNAAGDLPAIEENAKKLRSLSDKQFLQALIASLPEAWFTYFQDPNTWPEAITCIRCYDMQTLKAMLLNQWCTYWTSLPA